MEATDEENSRHSVVVVGVDDDERVRKSQVAPTPTSPFVWPCLPNTPNWSFALLPVPFKALFKQNILFGSSTSQFVAKIVAVSSRLMYTAVESIQASIMLHE